MPRFPCPICGDPNVYLMWVDATPPEGCPYDDSWMNGGRVTIRSVAECPYQRHRAEQRARTMKLCPEAFDENGNMVKGGLAMVLRKMKPGDPPIVF